MLGDISMVTELYVICGYTDMRKSIDGLCTIIKEQLHMEPENTSALTGSKPFSMNRMGSSCSTRNLIQMLADTDGLVIKAR